MQSVKLGIVGCGMISEIYCKVAQTFNILEIVACADLDRERAAERARQFSIPKIYTPEQLLADPEVQLVVNLTVPLAHAEVSLGALRAGKHVYTEKPLATSAAAAREILDLGRARGLLVGSAPDTFLGGGLQTCRALIDQGAIGEPIGATAFMVGHGPEGWHPAPEMFYQHGGGPMWDMGPYYLTALVSLIGAVRRVTGSARISFPERTITSKPKYGQTITVQTPTHIAGVLDFAGGAIGTILTSFDVWGAQLPRIEIYGTLGSLSVPDPNTFGGPVQLLRFENRTWADVPIPHGFSGNSRGLGILDMAYALRSGRPYRASGELAYHVIEIMEAIHLASREGRHVELSSAVERPDPLAVDFPATEA